MAAEDRDDAKGEGEGAREAVSAAPSGRYLLRERLARGGMGEVFRAVAVGPSGFEKPVIVKRILPGFAGREDFVDLFVAEAKRMALLAHPNIVQVIDFGVGDRKDYFLVLELVDGLDLERLRKAYEARKEPFPLGLALLIAEGVLRGLHYAHTQAFPDGVGLVHRDVSPSNVLLSKVGEAKIADFGVALVRAPERGSEQPSTLVGKVAYMAPEQFDGLSVDARADVFAWGVTLFELLTNELPFRGKQLEYRASARDGVRKSLLELRPDTPPELEAILVRATAPRPEDRFESARAMSKALEGVARLVGAASADDLAEAVRRDAAAIKPKRLVRLGAPAVPEPDEPEVADAGELTRAVKDGRIAFTVKLASDGAQVAPPAPEPATVRLPDARPPLAPKSGRRGAWLLGSALVALALVATLAARFGAPKAAASSHIETANTSSSVSTSAIVEQEPAPPASASAPPSEASSTVGAASAPRPRPAGVQSSAPKASASASPSPSAVADVGGCRGAVHLFATHGWVVSGGPRSVQAPGRYEDWPCGHYSLRAVSRSDPNETRESGVTIRAGSPAVVDLR